jgi:FkbM family methyltransferase
VNYLIKYRIDTILSKEPDTINWIKGFKKDDIFFDIGANIGLYSCFAAKNGITTYSFEPSVFNTEILVKNININNLNSLITLVPLCLHQKSLVSNFNLSSDERGAALSTFSESYTHDGKKLNITMSYNTLGISLDEFIKLFSIPYPNKIKIDVDGIEHLILKGAENVLKKCDSILIEVNENFSEQFREVKTILSENNFSLKEKNKTSDSILFEKSFNQIWEKNIKL